MLPLAERQHTPLRLHNTIRKLPRNRILKARDAQLNRTPIRGIPPLAKNDLFRPCAEMHPDTGKRSHVSERELPRTARDNARSVNQRIGKSDVSEPRKIGPSLCLVQFQRAALRSRRRPIFRTGRKARSTAKIGLRHHLRGGQQETPEKKSPIPSSSLLASRRAALGQDRASMAILERYRHASSRPLRALSARQGVYPSHLAASFSTVPSSWSFLMASLMALVSSGLSLFTATAYSSPVATSRTTWASL